MDANGLCLSIASTTFALPITSLFHVKARLFGDGMADPMNALANSARPLAAADQCCLRPIARSRPEERISLASGEARIGSQRVPGGAWTSPRIAERTELFSTDPPPERISRPTAQAEKSQPAVVKLCSPAALMQTITWRSKP